MQRSLTLLLRLGGLRRDVRILVTHEGVTLDLESVIDDLAIAEAYAEHVRRVVVGHRVYLELLVLFVQEHVQLLVRNTAVSKLL